MSIFSQRARALDGKKRLVLKVHAPQTSDNDFARFVNELNNQLSLISEHLTKAQNIDLSDFVTTQALEDAIRDLQATQADDSTSQAPDGPTDTSVGAPNPPEDAAAAIQNAAPDAAPPPVKTTSDIGTTTDPLQFSLEDHTHAGYAAVRANAGTEITRRRLNVIQGAGITVALVDDNPDDEAELTISAAGTGSVIATTFNATTAFTGFRVDRTVLDANCLTTSTVLVQARSTSTPDAENFNAFAYNIANGQFDVGIISLDGPFDFSTGYTVSYILVI